MSKCIFNGCGNEHDTHENDTPYERDFSEGMDDITEDDVAGLMNVEPYK